MMILLKEVNVNVNALCTASTLKSTSSASRAISAVAERFAISDNADIVIARKARKESKSEKNMKL